MCLHKYGVDLADPCCYPLGFMYISTVLKAAGHEVKVLNYNLYDYCLGAELEGQDAVCFTGFADFLPQIKRAAACARAMGVKTVVGGALATFCTDDMAAICDVVVTGEGESIICEAIKSRGVFFGKSIDVNNLPYPDYDGFGVDEYHRRNPYRHVGVLTQRGCPYSCTFCAQTCKTSRREVESCLAEICHYQQRYAPDYIVVNDNTFNLDKRRVKEFCAYFKMTGQKWSAALRADLFDEDMAYWMATSYCSKVIIGVESFSDTKLQSMNKKANVAQIRAALDLLHEYNIDYHANLLVGFPGETFSQILEEVQSIPEHYNVTPCTVRPFLGTKWGGTNLLPIETSELNMIFKQMAAQKGLTYWT